MADPRPGSRPLDRPPRGESGVARCDILLRLRDGDASRADLLAVAPVFVPKATSTLMVSPP